MNKTQLMKKMAESKTKLADHIQHWGLPKEKLFPLDNRDLLKTAVHAFEHQIEDMTSSQRLVAARNICGRAQELGEPVESSLAYKYASAQLSDHFRTFLSLRKQATAHLHDSDLDKLLEVAQVFSTKADINDRVKGLDKVASALEDFDREHDLVGHWGHWFPDPGYSTYGLTESPDQEVSLVVKVADGYNARAEDFERADWSRVQGKLPDEVVDGLKTANDKLAVFASLPAPEREIIFQSLFTE